MAIKKFYLLFSILLSMVGTKALAYDIAIVYADGKVIYYNYTNNEKELEVTQGDLEYNGSVVIPKEVSYMSKTLKVTSIGESAFYRCSGLTSITIPNSVTSIGNRAFNGCSGLTSITIPNSVTSIGESAFGGCSGLTSVTIPNSVTSIGEYAFSGCSGLTSITIPNSVTSIGEYAFSGCSGLTSVTIPNSVTRIGLAAFASCRGLTSITIPNSVTSIGNAAFGNCSDLTSITIGNSVTSIGNYAFRDCRSLTSITIPNSVTSIGDNAFYNCSGLTSITIPNSVTSIGELAFYGCKNLIEVRSEITNPFTIDNSVFNSISSDAKLQVPQGTINKYKALSGWTANFKEIVEYGSNDSNISFADATVKQLCVNNWDTNGDGELSYDEAAAVADIGTVFKGWQDITSFEELNYFIGLTSIGNDAFSGCRNLASITIPNSVTTIGQRAFQNCSGLTSITIPNSVTSIGRYAFDSCHSMASLTIPNSVTSIGDNPFRANRLTSINVEYGNAKYDSRDNCNAIIETGTNTLISGCKNTTIPNSVTSIGDDAFSYSVASITIPNSVTSIGQRAFEGCSGLTSITIPNSVTTIGQRAFFGCSGLTSVTIPNSVTTIEDYAFMNCSKVCSITILYGVTTIGDYAFSGCSYGSHVTALDKLYITIPNSVTSIGNYAFRDCRGLTSITIPNSVTSIGDYAFQYCPYLSEVRSEITNPFEISNSVFNSISSDAKLQVPKGTKSKYQALSGWTANFKEIVEYGGTATYTLSITSSGSGYVTYSGNTINGTTRSYTVNEGSSATLTFSPNSGYRVGNLKVNNVDVTSSISNNKYTISNITKNTTVSVTFEADPQTTYKLSVTCSGEGYVYLFVSGYTGDADIINKSTFTYSVKEGTLARLTFSDFYGCRVRLKVNGIDVTSDIDNTGYALEYTISSIVQDTNVDVVFEKIPQTTYTLSITSSGSGSVTYAGHTIQGTTSLYDVDEGASATLTFTPNSGYQIGGVWVNDEDVTSSVSNYQYTISNINENTTVSVTFEEIPPQYYNLNISSSYGGEVSYSGFSISATTKDFLVTEGTSVTFTITPNSGYRVGSFIVNETDYTSSISNNQFTISDIGDNITVIVTFEAIPITTYTLSITSSGSGSVSYGGNTIRETTRTYTVNAGTTTTMTFNPSSGYKIGSVKVNGINYTSYISNNQFTINNFNKDYTVEVTFEEITYSLSISSSVMGMGYVTYAGITINGTTKTFRVTKGSSVTLTFYPNSGYRIKSVMVNDVDVTSSISNNQYTISNFDKDYTVVVAFEAIPVVTYSLSITSSGSGYVTYSNYTIKEKTQTYTVNEGASATLTFYPNDGYRIGSVKVNDVDVTSDVSNNKYTISNITKNTTVSVMFEAIPVTTYTLSITSSGNGYVTYSGNKINGATMSYIVKEGASATLTFTPNSGYRVGSLKVNNVDVTSSISNNKYTISNITKNTTVNVTFEEIPPITYTLSISSSGNGSVTYLENFISSSTKTFTVNEGTTVTLTFTPNDGYRIGSLYVDNTDVTSSISNNTYTIGNINRNISVSVVFNEIPVTSLTYNDVNYRVLSNEEKTVNVANGTYGLSLEIPAAFAVNGMTWKVRGIDDDVMAKNPQLLAVIWNPELKFEVNVSNPNFLLYVTSAEYAPTSPSSIRNVIVNGTVNNIVLTDAASGNDFYCPRAFTAMNISYTHNYSMTTGINESRGWETIALPFDVQTIKHATKGEIVPFAKWSNSDSRRPFWLYELTSNGWSEAEGIKAYTPYVISMPNNDQYYDEARLNGSVTFSATNVTVPPTVVKSVSYWGKTLTSCFATKTASVDIFALNVKNQWASETNGQKEGSTFVQNLRTVHPFEAYMTTTNTTRSSFGIFEDMTTGIRGITELMDKRQMKGVYNLKGQKIKVEADKKLPAGVYIINGQKTSIK